MTELMFILLALVVGGIVLDTFIITPIIDRL